MSQEMVNIIIATLGKYGVSMIGLFGSYARGEQTPESDLDILVTFRERISLIKMVGIERELSESLGIKVDLLTEQALSPYLVDRVKADLKVIYQ